MILVMVPTVWGDHSVPGYHAMLIILLFNFFKKQSSKVEGVISMNKLELKGEIISRRSLSKWLSCD